MIEATTIELYRAEGRADGEAGTRVVVDTGGVRELARKGDTGRPIGRYIDTACVWTRAAAVLAAWSYSAPAEGGYHKCDFVVTYADGSTYGGRFDLVRMTIGGYPDPAAHMREHCELSSGRRKPSRATREQWEGYLRDVVGAERRARYESFLTDYQIGAGA